MDDDPSEATRVWLVERGYNNRDLVILKYATPDGERRYRRELSSQALDTASVTAAKDVPADDLEAVDDDEVTERYAAEAARMADEHAPDDEI